VALNYWFSFVMPGLDPGIHVFLDCIQGVMAGVKPGHDD
jgi:hypothetical protein